MNVNARFENWFKNIGNMVAGSQKLDLSNFSLPPAEKFVPGFAAVMAGFVAASVLGLVAAGILMPKPVPFATIAGLADSTPHLAGADKITDAEFKTIISRNIFNSEGVAANEIAKKDATCTPVKSELPLKFTGVIFGGTKQTSLVLLESTATKQADTFLLGDAVPGDAKIVDITKERVYFERNACPEYLELLQSELPKRRVAGAPKRNQAPKAATGNETTFREDGFERTGNNVAVTRQWVDKALSVDFAKTLQDAKASPNMVGNEVRGFVLTRIRPDSVYEKMGLQDGDVIEAINGIELNDAARAIQTLNAMRNEGNIELQVKKASSGQSSTAKIQVK